MVSSIVIQPLVQELPSHFADRLGIYYSKSVNQADRKVRGQFFTPVEIATLMASFAKTTGTTFKILDPGCGTAILSCSLIEQLVSNEHVQSIELVAYETDTELIPICKMSLDYIKEWLRSKEINFHYSLISKDFVLEKSAILSDNELPFSKEMEKFDIVISNPPYFKLSIDDKRSLAAKNVINGHPNIYSIFMAISAKLLKQNGEIIFITPRSYASGSYFKLFREYFFNLINIDNVHLFVSRKETFNRNKVLQETVIIKGTRARNNHDHTVTVSSSHGLKDIHIPHEKNFKQHVLIDLTSHEKILYLPTNDFEESIVNIFKNWDGSLNKYNIQISTGPVVGFRSRKYIQNNYENGTIFLAPLFWLHNVKQMTLEWPVTKPEKGQYLRIENESKGILIPNKDYIFLRRFSSKDDKSRLIAAPYLQNYDKSDYIGVENKVNYIYRPKGSLEINEVIGMCALLNSSLFDSYFRIFNGNVNVSATELRAIPLPELETIKEIGNKMILSMDYSVENCNRIVINQFELLQCDYD